MSDNMKCASFVSYSAYVYTGFNVVIIEKLKKELFQLVYKALLTKIKEILILLEDQPILDNVLCINIVYLSLVFIYIKIVYEAKVE